MTEFTTKLRNSTAFLSLAIMLQSCSGNGGLLLLMPDEVTNFGTFLWAALSFPIVCSLTTAVISLLLSRLFMGSNAKLALTLFYILFFFDSHCTSDVFTLRSRNENISSDSYYCLQLSQEITLSC